MLLRGFWCFTRQRGSGKMASQSNRAETKGCEVSENVRRVAAQAWKTQHPNSKTLIILSLYTVDHRSELHLFFFVNPFFMFQQRF
jgi:hypothetical protein